MFSKLAGNGTNWKNTIRINSPTGRYAQLQTIFWSGLNMSLSDRHTTIQPDRVITISCVQALLAPNASGIKISIPPNSHSIAISNLCEAGSLLPISGYGLRADSIFIFLFPVAIVSIAAVVPITPVIPIAGIITIMTMPPPNTIYNCTD